MMMKKSLFVLCTVLACSMSLTLSDDSKDEQLRLSMQAFYEGRKELPMEPQMSKCVESIKAASACIKPPIKAECCNNLKQIKEVCAEANVVAARAVDVMLGLYCSNDKPGEAPKSPSFS